MQDIKNVKGIKDIKILIIGSGGREHSIVRKLSESKCQLYYCGNIDNPGMNKYAKMINVKQFNIDNICEKAKEYNITFAIIGPENPINDGIVDSLMKIGINSVGPIQRHAKIETSKYWSRKFMMRNGLSKYCPKFMRFTPNDKLEIDSFLFDIKNGLVIKADGLHGGKGVRVFDDMLTNPTNFNNCVNYRPIKLGRFFCPAV